MQILFQQKMGSGPSENIEKIPNGKSNFSEFPDSLKQAAGAVSDVYEKIFSQIDNSNEIPQDKQNKIRAVVAEILKTPFDKVRVLSVVRDVFGKNVDKLISTAFKKIDENPDISAEQKPVYAMKIVNEITSSQLYAHQWEVQQNTV